MAAEVRILDLVAPVLAAEGVAVPDWQVRAPDLLAYPVLPGTAGLALSETGEVLWHTDPASPDYAARLGCLLARVCTRVCCAGGRPRYLCCPRLGSGPRAGAEGAAGDW